VIEIVALARAFAHAGEDRIATMRFRDVVDQFHDQNGLAHAGAAEQADLAALGVRRHQVDDLDAGFENLRFRRLLGIARRFLVDGAAGLGVNRAGFVHRLADHVHDAAERGIANRHRDRRAGIGNILPAHQTLGRVHRDAAHRVFAQMLRDLENQAVAQVLGFERIEDFRQMIIELNVDDRTDHLRNTTLRLRHGTDPRSLMSDQSASAPEMISMSSLVIIA
jgi:hypothetical protein